MLISRAELFIRDLFNELDARDPINFGKAFGAISSGLGIASGIGAIVDLFRSNKQRRDGA